MRSGGVSNSGENAFRTMPPGAPRFVDHSIGREEISIEAMSLIGIPYRWGGNTPESGFDCSGLVKYVVARAADIDLPRTTAEMSRRGESIEPDEIAPGDLIFFNTEGRPHSHVGIYVGKLRFVNAPSTGGTVRLDYLTNPYWARHFDGIRRVAPPLERPSPFDAPTELAAQPPPAIPQTPAEPPMQATVAAARAPISSTPPLANSSNSTPDQTAASPMPNQSAAPVASTAPGAATGAEDPIDAAADAFEPPPPAAAQAAQQALQAGAPRVQIQPMPTESHLQIMRASTIPSVQRAPSSTTDDPIARFANGAQ